MQQFQQFDIEYEMNNYPFKVLFIFDMVFQSSIVLAIYSFSPTGPTHHTSWDPLYKNTKSKNSYRIVSAY